MLGFKSQGLSFTGSVSKGLLYIKCASSNSMLVRGSPVLAELRNWPGLGSPVFSTKRRLICPPSNPTAGFIGLQSTLLLIISKPPLKLQTCNNQASQIPVQTPSFRLSFSLISNSILHSWGHIWAPLNPPLHIPIKPTQITQTL